MRALDIDTITVMTRPMADGGLRATAQQRGVDIAQVFFTQGTDGAWHRDLIWVAPAWRGRGLVAALCHAVCSDPSSDEALAEVSMGNVARAGLLGVGLLGLGQGGYAALQPQAPVPAVPADVAATRSVQAQPAAPQPAAAVKPQPKPPTAAVPRTTAVDQAQVHNFPAELRGLDQKDAKTRVAAFVRVMLPIIDAENAKILQDRKRLQQILASKRTDTADWQWMEQLLQRYNAADMADLLLKVDAIPRSMAVAQAAVESGWGQDTLAQTANVFYGQKSWDDRQPQATGAKGEKYRAFVNPQQAVSEYMRNLNSHRAYAQFRQGRADLRRAGRPLDGLKLIRALSSYSTKGSYAKMVASIIHKRGLNKLDLG